MAWEKEIGVEILVNGSVAQEYNDDDDDDGTNQESQTATKYIEAISGAEFAVQYTVKASFQFESQLMTFAVSIDGKELESATVSKDDFEESPGDETGCLTGIWRSHGLTSSLQKFIFSEIRSSDDQTQITHDDLKDRAADIGTIVVTVHREHKGVYCQPGTAGPSWYCDGPTELGTLSEKALKGQALSHSTSVSMPEFISPMGCWSECEYLDGEDNPFAVFEFKYRSRKALQDLRIIERTPAPVPLEERSIEELTFEEARELLRQQRERQASTIAQMKADIRPERGMKHEYEDDEEYSALLESARANKVPRIFEPGEVINLLGD